MATEQKRCTVLLTFDFDAESLWEDSGLDTPTYVSRGRYGADVGVPRILDLLARYGLPATFFVPGITVKRYPDIVREISSRGHELGHHGYFHTSPTEMTADQERAALVQGLEAFEQAAGVRPVGYRSPSWDLSHHSIPLLLEHGFLYDSSLMANDFHLYSLTEASASPGLHEIPVAWELDDAPHFMFNFSPRYRMGLSSPSKVYEIWLSEFEGAYAEDGVFTLTMHPQIIGRYHRIQMLERLIREMSSRPGVSFMTCTDAVRQWLEARASWGG